MAAIRTGWSLRPSAMEASGNAIAILGNHELNALLFHGKGDNAERDQSGFMRAHSVNNVRQHESFLREFPVGNKHTLEALEWFQSLPVFLDLGPIRLVHAYWDTTQIEIIRERNADGRLRSHDLQELAFENDATPFAERCWQVSKDLNWSFPPVVHLRIVMGV
ncbi:hypothetical protein [Pararhizobium gei]|uniref:hypothetical protein n=1 Tax=Pararhizobium gei TaxID=1395951 RepID=UPI0023DB30E4|nr:hypothetical protein [Rhizobium gei]